MAAACIISGRRGKWELPTSSRKVHRKGDLVLGLVYSAVLARQGFLGVAGVLPPPVDEGPHEGRRQIENGCFTTQLREGDPTQ